MYERYSRFVSVRFLIVFRYQTTRHLQVGIFPMQKQVAGLYVESNRTVLACVAQSRSAIPIAILVFFCMRIRKTASQRVVEEVWIIHVYQRLSLCATLSLVDNINQRFSRSFYFRAVRRLLVYYFPFPFFYTVCLRNQLIDTVVNFFGCAFV